MPDNDEKPILVAVDFSAHSEAALVWAAKAARYFGVRLIVLHVVHDPASAPGYYSRPDEVGAVRFHEEVAVEMLDEFIQKAANQRPDLIEAENLLKRVVIGLPATRIIEVAEEGGAGLIVVGSQGRTGLARALLGSKAERVAQLSPVPVTIIKGEGFV